MTIKTVGPGVGSLRDLAVHDVFAHIDLLDHCSTPPRLRGAPETPSHPPGIASRLTGGTGGA
jgi:hypothetical protein